MPIRTVLYIEPCPTTSIGARLGNLGRCADGVGGFKLISKSCRGSGSAEAGGGVRPLRSGLLEVGSSSRRGTSGWRRSSSRRKPAARRSTGVRESANPRNPRIRERPRVRYNRLVNCARNTSRSLRSLCKYMQIRVLQVCGGVHCRAHRNRRRLGPSCAHRSGHRPRCNRPPVPASSRRRSTTIRSGSFRQIYGASRTPGRQQLSVPSRNWPTKWMPCLMTRGRF